MSGAGGLKMGSETRGNILPINQASGPGFLGPPYNPADEMLPPASIGVHRGGDLNDVIGAVRGVIYYGDMMGFGEASSGFTSGMPGLKPLGVNYFINSGLTCSNGATMWEYVQTIPTGSAMGEKVKQSLRSVGLPGLRGMAPGILEDAESALNPFPVINAVVGSGFPKCRLAKMRVGNFDGQITNVDGKLLVDPEGLIRGNDGSYYQEHWIQDRKVPLVRKAGETGEEQFLRGDPVQLDYDQWDSEEKLYGENGCLLDQSNANTKKQPSFCSKTAFPNIVRLPDGSTIKAYSDDKMSVGLKTESFEDYRLQKFKKTHSMVSFSVAVISVVALFAFLNMKKK